MSWFPYKLLSDSMHAIPGRASPNRGYYSSHTGKQFDFNVNQVHKVFPKVNLICVQSHLSLTWVLDMKVTEKEPI